MDIYRVGFIGHRKLLDFGAIETKLEQTVIQLLKTHPYVEFYVGRNGDFDIYVASAIKRAQKKLGHETSTLILTLPYHMKDEFYYKDFYDELYYPLSSKIHPKAAIIARNNWIAENMHLLVTYVANSSGGAYNTMKHAQKNGVPIFNLAKNNTLN